MLSLVVVRAILGPTNTGKTHLAIERMVAHSSGVMGFPLRLLAREVYDRVVRLKGERSVALITGEERICPADARYFLCTAESMPTDKDVAFVALDEAQLGRDGERGHVFTDRMLRARGREETLILGSETLRPIVRALLPDAEIITRPRFSTLSFAGSCKLSRLPPRSAVVAFSQEEVYAVAEALRRFRGGAAVVMGALSPQTRNAQVAMFQACEVDYLVATDAVGMGLNLDVKHVAFASLNKFDGRRTRRLFTHEIAQIAGRAGRHQRDGTFGTLSIGAGATPEFTPEEVEAVEAHSFEPLPFVYWREGKPDVSSVDALVASLERRPDDPALRPAPTAVDLAVLKSLADDLDVRPSGTADVRRLWAVCGLPDFRKSGPQHHAQLVKRLWGFLAGGGRVSGSWFADQVQRLDNPGGDVETIADRIAGVRTWAYIAHRADWLDNPAEWAERTRAVEARLSDALHAALTQRFVDRRTTALLRDLGARGADALPFEVGEDGAVSVGGEAIGTLSGFTFHVDPGARATDRRMLLAAAERRLGQVLERRAAELSGDEDAAFALDDEGRIAWRGTPLARVGAGPVAWRPQVRLEPVVGRLPPLARGLVETRARRWLEARMGAVLGGWLRLAEAAGASGAPAPVRAVLAAVVGAGGVIEREAVALALAGVDRDGRRHLSNLGLRVGALHLFAPALLKPEAMRWRALLLGLPADLGALGRPLVEGGAELEALGYHPLGERWLRVDLVERLAAHAHRTREGDPVDRALAISLGLTDPWLARLMRDLGFRLDEAGAWRWRGRRAPKPVAAPARPGNPFGALAGIRSA